MQGFLQYFRSLDLNYTNLILSGIVLFLGSLLFSLLGKFIFGTKSTLNRAGSSAFSILFLYGFIAVLSSAGAQFQHLIASLPYVTIENEMLTLFSFSDATFTIICGELLSMIVLSFLVNIADILLPRGKNIIIWLFTRCLSVLLALALHLISTRLLSAYLPEGIVSYAPPILLGILVIMLLTGILKIFVGIAISIVNPVIAAVYTFFFANIIGKEITKAVITTALLTALVFLLQYLGITEISIAASALWAYIPFVFILTALWYATCRYL